MNYCDHILKLFRPENAKEVKFTLCLKCKFFLKPWSTAFDDVNHRPVLNTY